MASYCLWCGCAHHECECYEQELELVSSGIVQVKEGDKLEVLSADEPKDKSTLEKSL